MIWVLHSDIIPGNLASKIWRTNAYKLSYIRKERRANITERWRNGDWMALNGHWNVPAIQSTEWWLKGDWMAPFSFNWMVAFRLVFLANWLGCVQALCLCKHCLFFTEHCSIHIICVFYNTRNIQLFKVSLEMF